MTEGHGVFTDDELAYLAGQRLGRIATASASGVPDVAAVTFGVDGDEIVIGGIDNPQTIKYRNVVATRRAAFVVDDLASIEPWRPRGVKVRGEAAPGNDARGRATIRIRPRTIWSWGVNPDASRHFLGIIERREV